MFLRIRDHIGTLLKTAGAFKLGEAIANATGDSWTMLACVDRLEELGEIRRVGPAYPDVGTSDQVYVKGNASR